MDISIIIIIIIIIIINSSKILIERSYIISARFRNVRNKI